ncbi:MAG: tRNA (guanosine(46)-N7)-methyltransferase TrmB [Boseongicola sp. SB0664_bin_43]|uniref:tRNA (guanine-N(7)-)-methyltransferase n=1 Tax=Boseongicola sp. SB0664_bin_43 TaxID=2604844 RepID=A0A6B0Y0W8_9RHOB|nr:tRNA (guanosine(46)-N7)-methyltransferase TrmB [Boseongicola sp. SB0664_bin_43]
MARKPPSDTPWRNLYGRARGRGLRTSQKRYLDDLAQVGLTGVKRDENPARKKLDLEATFGDRPVWLEVGFGGGEHLVHQAVRNPGVGFVAAEPYIDGVAKLLGRIRSTGVRNIRIYPGDARDLMDVLPEQSVEVAFLLYPDPWPKRKHHRRRFVTPEHLGPLFAILAPGARFRISTDIPDYVRQAMEEVPKAGFAWQAERPDDWRKPWKDWLPTRYEQKAVREGRTPTYLTFRKPDA